MDVGRRPSPWGLDMSTVTDVMQLSESERQQLQTWLADFEKTWQDERLETRARDLPPAESALRFHLLIGMVAIDVQKRWQAGTRVLIETYLARYPELGNVDTAPTELIQAEYRARIFCDPFIDLSEFARRFPKQVAELRRKMESGMDTLTSPDAVGLDKSTLPTAVGAAGQAAPQVGDMPENFGRYRILKILGRGGMGTVYLAQDTQLDRQVALKVPHFTPEDSGRGKERFFREARAAAALHHPNVCPVYDVGAHDGIDYLTMAYIEGQSLSQRIRQGPPIGQREAADFVRQIALALDEAHARGIIHRDLKPSNVILNSHGEPVVMDFGLARRTHAGDERLTKTGDVLGTPAYMAPEQVVGDIDTVGAGSDIYSLGVIFYELLTGAIPFKGSVGSILARILTEQPARPTLVNPRIEPALEAICLKALAKNVADRYARMADMAAVLAAYLATAPADAGAPAEVRGSTSPLESATPVLESGAHEEPTRVRPADGPQWQTKKKKKLMRLLGFFLACAAALGGLTVLTVIYLSSATSGTIRLELTGKADGIAVFVDDVEQARADPGAPLRLAVGQHRLLVKNNERVLADRTIDLRRGDNGVLTIPLLPPPLNGKPPLPEPMPVPAVEEAPGEIRLFLGHADAVWCVAYAPDGRTILSGSEDATVRLWEAGTGKEVQRFEGHKSIVNSVAFAPDSARALSGSDDKCMNLWEINSGKLVRAFEHERVVNGVAFTPDGKRGLAACGDKIVHIWDLETGNETGRFDKHTLPVRCLAVTTDGRRALSGGDDKTIRLWEIATGKEIGVLEGHTEAVIGVAVAPDGKRALSVGFDKTLRLWDLDSRRELRQLAGHAEAVLAAAIAPDGRRALSGGEDKTLRLWDLASGKELASLKGHTEAVNSVAFSPDGKLAVSGSTDQTVRLWRLPGGDKGKK